MTTILRYNRAFVAYNEFLIIIISQVRAYFLHNTHYAGLRAECVTLARDLIKSGWKWEDLSLHFHEAQGILEKQGRYKMLKSNGKSLQERCRENCRTIDCV